MTDTSALALSIFALIVSVVSAVAALGGWIAAKRQLEAGEAAERAGTLLTLFEFLHQSEQRIARSRLRDPSVAELDTEAARSVASAFDFAGVLVRHRLVEADIFLDYWGDLLRFLGKRLGPYLDERLFGESTGREYWKDFAWLLKAAAERNTPSSQGMQSVAQETHRG